MRPLLLDQNLAPRLVSHLADLYPDAIAAMSDDPNTGILMLF